MIPYALYRRWIFLALVVCAPFSFVPSVALPVYEFTSFRIGLYQILALVFVLLCIVPMTQDYIKTRLTREDRYIYGSILMLSGIVAYTLTSAIEPARSLLMTVSFCFLLVLVLCARWYVRTFSLDKTLAFDLMCKAGIVFGVVSIVQLIVATFAPDNALLCRGCSASVFGFPRINGFAAEPLFWANALLPFWIVALHSYAKYRTRLGRLALILTTISIVLTFSRGAYLAVSVMALGYFIYHRTREHLPIITLLSICVVGSFGLFVASSAVANRDSGGVVRETASGIVEHLTFGRVSFAEAVPTAPVEVAEPEDSFDSQGYVEASTSERTTSAELAFQAWRRPSNTLLGVGLGNLGPYVVNNIDSSAPSNLTVYIYYVLLLAEIGIAGLAFVLGLYAVALRRLYRIVSDEMAGIILLSLIGFLIHYLFFGSSINVVYIWLWLGIGLGYHKSNAKDKQKVAHPVS